MQPLKIPGLLVLAGGLLFLAGCGKKAETTTDLGDWPGMEADLQRTLQEQSDFYVFKTPEDWQRETASLVWDDASDLPEFADPNAKKGGTFRYFISDFPRTLRTIGPDATGGIRPYLLDYVAMPSMEIHPNVPGRVYPGVAEKWAVDRDTRTVYIRLDPAARWSDGKPVTTADIVFTWYFYRSPITNEPWYADFYTKTHERLTVYDELHYAVTLPELKPDILEKAGNIAPYPKHAFADYGPDWIEKYNWRVLPTTGAYTLRDRDVDKGRAITLTRVEDWWAKDRKFWRGRYNPDRYRLTVIRDPNKAFEAFQRGDIDMFPIGRPELWYEKLPDTHPDVQAGYIAKTKFFNRTPRPDWGLWINRSQPLLDNRDIREGIHFATDFDQVVTNYFRGDSVRMQTRSDGYSWRTHPTITARPFDPARAREFFAKAGFDQQGPDGVLRNEAGQRLAFTITTYAKALEAMLPVLKQQALKAGLDLDIEMLDATTGWKKVQEKQHQIALVALSRSVEQYPRYWEMYHGSNAYDDAYLDASGAAVPRFADGTPNPKPAQVNTHTNNMTMTFIPELDRLIEAYDRSSTMEEIKRHAVDIEQIIHDDAGWVPGWATPFYRTGYWRHVKWPAGFNVMQSREAEEMFLHWIDSDEQAALEAARRAKTTFEPQILVFDQFKTQ
jgi:microcin C transport system substrate-binding protein